MKKKKIIITSSILLVALTSIPLTVNVMLFSLPNVYHNTFYGGMKNKINLLKNTKEKKIVIIGGSSVPFSVDSHLIKQYLNDYQPVDFGLYASLGTNVMLDLASNYIHQNDIYIITPEISSQTLSMYYNGLETYKALEQNKNLLFSLDDHMKESLVGNAPKFVSEKLSYLTTTGVPLPTDIYSVSSFNEYGDIKINRDGNIMLNGLDSNHMINLSIDIIEDDFINKMNDFNKLCLKKKAICYYRFSPMNDASIINKDNIETFYNHLNDKINFQIMGDPYLAIMEKEYFYDTNYHLNSSGVINWTKELIKDIKLTLDDVTPTDIIEADKPPLINPESKDGDNNYLAYFTYDVNDGVTINKLIKEDKRIVIPYTYSNKAITSFKADVFINSKTVKEITIQDNIRIIHDYSFSNSKIEKIIIDNDKPNSIGVGDHLLDNSNAFIYVKKNNLSAYKTSYNWAKYANKIKEL